MDATKQTTLHLYNHFGLDCSQPIIGKLLPQVMKPRLPNEVEMAQRLFWMGYVTQPSVAQKRPMLPNMPYMFGSISLLSSMY
jgi:hypothetical protein